MCDIKDQFLNYCAIEYDKCIEGLQSSSDITKLSDDDLKELIIKQCQCNTTYIDAVIYCVKNNLQLKGNNNSPQVVNPNFVFVLKSDITHGIDPKTADITPNGSIKNLSPICIPSLFGGGGKTIMQIIACFNAEEGAHRVFDEIHLYKKKDPFITVGFGHLAKKNVDSFLKSMKSQIREEMIDCMAYCIYNNVCEVDGNKGEGKGPSKPTAQLAANINGYTYLDQFNYDPVVREYNTSGKRISSIDEIKKALDHFFIKKNVYDWSIKIYGNVIKENTSYKLKEDGPWFKDKYWKDVDTVCTASNPLPGNSDTKNYYISFWFYDVFRTALRLVDVCKSQVSYYINDYMEFAKGYLYVASVAAYLSWKSNGMTLPKGMTKDVKAPKDIKSIPVYRILKNQEGYPELDFTEKIDLTKIADYQQKKEFIWALFLWHSFSVQYMCNADKMKKAKTVIIDGKEFFDISSMVPRDRQIKIWYQFFRPIFGDARPKLGDKDDLIAKINTILVDYHSEDNLKAKKIIVDFTQEKKELSV